ncbi:N-6 DNA methylase [Actibacterium sp. 188UL27-1]|uniref:Eco57I restriction-modification methylase domain-containing protein n=1 Tax=Actibacterium sp. 188UL27-1 TaxID=2786961 RepID=UPI00195EE379|nr:N-6 DNA methylase [Actibacterium sp. 188UL27-1]MBM7067576.1 N-6 DNA methylase [Actibacterium sp. 188UL27-1]
MARRPVTDLSAWPSISLEGNLIAPAMLARIDERAAPEQSPEDYGVRKGLTLREEVSTAFRVGQSHFDAFSKLSNPSADATRRFMRAFLKETFGFDDIEDGGGLIAHSAGGHRIPVIVVPPDEDRLDRRSPTLSGERSRSPAFALQDYLNEEDDALWGLATNGMVIRLMRDNASLTRPAFIEADLAQIFSNEDAASFGLLWLLVHRSRFDNAGAPATDCALERWRETGTKEGEVARDRLAAQVEQALNILGSGFLEANPALAAKLQSGEQNLTEWFNELLRLVYRLIFLMVAEDRNLLHPKASRADARKLYADGYSLAHLRSQCFRGATWDRHHDRYEGIKIIFRSLAGGQEALSLPALGGLFAPNMLPSLETAKLRNRAFMEALYRLSWLQGKTGMAPVNWRAMEAEELGSVYESLLELQPQLGDDGKSLVFASDAAEQKGNQRKTTGSYYTPDSLVQALLDTALDPVLDKTEAEADDPETALLNLSVIDPACGSGHFLLSAARRIATRVARIRADGTPAQEDFRHALRDVARSCIHGVDRNPMAVELTKVALWIETVDPGLPLGFFDAQIRCGDALLGVFDLTVLEGGIPDAAYKPLTGDDKTIAKYYRDKNKREVKEREKIASGFGFNRQQDFMREFARLRAMPENTVRQIEAKSEKLRALTAEGAAAWTLETACDLYVSAFLLPKTKDDPNAGPNGLPRRGTETVPTSGAVWEWLRGVQLFGPLFANSIDAARKARAFHWPLEFPDIMQSGGFDVVLGNPPWERVKLQEQEFFALKDQDIATAKNAAARKKLIEKLAETNPPLAREWQEALRSAAVESHFMRESGRFPRGGVGDVNTYAVFTDQFWQLTQPEGYAGLIIPTGLVSGFTYRFSWGVVEFKIACRILWLRE